MGHNELMAPKLMVENFLKEDDVMRNFFYQNSLPDDEVHCHLKIKSDLTLSGLPFFCEVFKSLGATDCFDELLSYEGKKFLKKDNFFIEFKLPFNIALTGERVALNLLQRSSSISTMTRLFVDKSEKYNIAILDTRKTTPGLRTLEKYAVRMGGGYNHRMGPSDIFMIKDNHKNFFGGIKEAFKFFQNMKSFYSPLIVEIHSLDELQEAIDLGIQLMMLDNFSKDDIVEAIKIKKENMSFEISGGVTFENIDNFLIKGIDAISIGCLTYASSPVDLSLKTYRS